MLPSMLVYPRSLVYDAVLAVSAAALFPLCLAWTKSHSSHCDDDDDDDDHDRSAGGQHQSNHLANTVAMKTVSSNHVAADQVFRSITGLPH